MVETKKNIDDATCSLLLFLYYTNHKSVVILTFCCCCCWKYRSRLGLFWKKNKNKNRASNSPQKTHTLNTHIRFAYAHRNKDHIQYVKRFQISLFVPCRQMFVFWGSIGTFVLLSFVVAIVIVWVLLCPIGPTTTTTTTTTVPPVSAISLVVVDVVLCRPLTVLM